MLSRCGAVRAGAQKRDRAILDKVLNSSDTTTTAVYAEDGTTLVGIVLSFASFLAYQLSGSAAPVTLGSIAMGLLLSVIVVVLIQKTGASW